jgi:hypothetical protein
MRDHVSDVRKLLNTHGHAFQYSVLRRAEELCSERKSRWIFEAAEFPVGDAVAPIHADFVLSTRPEWAVIPNNAEHRAYVIAECKRADPARARWCFIKAPYTHRDPSEREIYFQQVRAGFANRTEPDVLRKSASIHTSHLGYELRTVQKGDGGGGGGGALRDATTQVLRAMNGFVDYRFPNATEQWERPIVTTFLPAVFTTASLLVAVGDLSVADLRTGELSSEWGEVEEVDWLWYTYNQSPALRHHVTSDAVSGSEPIARAIVREYSRTIAVVGPTGIDKFLAFDFMSWL